MASPSHQQSSCRPERFGRYVLLDRIASGGMAEVFRGRMVGVEGFQRVVALKRILPGVAADSDFVEMFVREAKMAETIRHANVAKVEELGVYDGHYFIAMEYVSGVSLRTLWDRARQRRRLLPIAMSCHIVQKVCEGLDAAHRKQDEITGKSNEIVHRDVSPQNILVSYEGDIKIIDFGIAKAANQVSKTQAGVLKGKFGYMSPEQVNGIELDNRSDIFACGTVLYELVVGGRLFAQNSDFATLEKIRKLDIDLPRRVNKNLSEELESIILKALAKDRDGRYRWAGEMAQALQRYLYDSDQNITRQDLQQYMNQHFQSEIAEERARLSAYRDLELEPSVEVEDPVITPPEATELVYYRATGDIAPKMLVPIQSSPVLVDDLSSPRSGSRAAVYPPTIAEPSGYRSPSDSYILSQNGSSSRDLVAYQPVLDSIPPGETAFNYLQTASYRSSTDLRPVQKLPTWAAVLLGVLLTLCMLAVGSAVYFREYIFSPRGDLLVEFSPEDATVLLDDRLVAKGSPVTLSSLSAGMHVVTVRKTGYDDIVRPITISRDEKSSIKVALQARPLAGRLNIYTTPPGLEIRLDGEVIGKTPAELRQLPVGAHELALYRQDGSLVRRRKIYLLPDTPEHIDLRVDGLPSQLQVVSHPSGAQVRINGLLRGVTPLNISDLEPGLASVEVRLPSCKVFRVRKQLDPGSVSVVSAELRCSR